jgi:hypothetical protein
MQLRRAGGAGQQHAQLLAPQAESGREHFDGEWKIGGSPHDYLKRIITLKDAA